MNVYCLFCRTQRCSRIAQLMEIRGVDKAFSPKILSRQRKEGKNLDRERDLLPGYVFLFNEERIIDYEIFSGIDGVIRRVGRTETGYELEGADREFALGLLEKEGRVGALNMVKIGETVRLEDTLFDGSEGVITKIDYRKERARVDFRFDGNACHTWVAIDGIRKADPGSSEK
jgi:transcription antitermination factor NusG